MFQLAFARAYLIDMTFSNYYK